MQRIHSLLFVASPVRLLYCLPFGRAVTGQERTSPTDHRPPLLPPSTTDRPTDRPPPPPPPPHHHDKANPVESHFSSQGVPGKAPPARQGTISISHTVQSTHVKPHPSIRMSKYKLSWKVQAFVALMTVQLLHHHHRILPVRLGFEPRLQLHEQQQQPPLEQQRRQQQQRQRQKLQNELKFWHDSYVVRSKLINESTALSWSDDGMASKFTDLFDIDPLNETTSEQVWNDPSRDLVYDRMNPSPCRAARGFLKAGGGDGDGGGDSDSDGGGGIKPHVLFSTLNSNWGAFATYVPNRTVHWGNLTENWSAWNCVDDIWTWLNHNNTLGVFTTQHQGIRHPKVHSIPIGFNIDVSVPLLNQLHAVPRVNKTQLLMINDSGNDDISSRARISQAVIRNFNGTVRNSYDTTGGWKVFMERYYQEMARSKFVLCPSGMGWDSFRIWETLSLGSIPIIEHYGRQHQDGWHRTLEGLPVLWVERMEDLTPQDLESYLDSVVRSGGTGPKFQYEKLTRQWWIDFVQSVRRYNY